MSDPVKHNEGVEMTGGSITADQFVVGRHSTANKWVGTPLGPGYEKLADTINDVANRIEASTDLTAAEKRKSRRILENISQEAREPEPDKSTLDEMLGGLMATVKSIPDIAKAAGALAPLLAKLIP